MGISTLSIIYNIVACQLIVDEYVNGIAETPGIINVYIFNGIICYNLFNIS